MSDREPLAATLKTCPWCTTRVPVGARVCPQCTKIQPYQGRQRTVARIVFGFGVLVVWLFIMWLFLV